MLRIFVAGNLSNQRGARDVRRADMEFSAMAHIDTSEIIRASVCIPPTGEALHSIDKAIRAVHDRVNAPRFKPHLTLLSGIETTRERAELHLRQLALRLEPFVIRLGSIAGRHDYFRALSATVELTDQLAAARRIAEEVFEVKSDAAFEPHVSLAYGDFHEPLQKQLAEEAGGALNVSFTAESVELTNATADRRISDWRVLAAMPLGAR